MSIVNRYAILAGILANNKKLQLKDYTLIMDGSSLTPSMILIENTDNLASLSSAVLKEAMQLCNMRRVDLPYSHETLHAIITGRLNGYLTYYPVCLEVTETPGVMVQFIPFDKTEFTGKINIFCNGERMTVWAAEDEFFIKEDSTVDRNENILRTLLLLDKVVTVESIVLPHYTIESRDLFNLAFNLLEAHGPLIIRECETMIPGVQVNAVVSVSGQKYISVKELPQAVQYFTISKAITCYQQAAVIHAIIQQLMVTYDSESYWRSIPDIVVRLQAIMKDNKGNLDAEELPVTTTVIHTQLGTKRIWVKYDFNRSVFIYKFLNDNNEPVRDMWGIMYKDKQVGIFGKDLAWQLLTAIPESQLTVDRDLEITDRFAMQVEYYLKHKGAETPKDVIKGCFELMKQYLTIDDISDIEYNILDI